LASGEPFPCGFGEAAVGAIQELSFVHVLVGADAFAEAAAVADQRPIFEDLGLTLNALEAAGAADQAEEPCQRCLTLDLGAERFASICLVLALQLGNPVDRLEEARRPQRSEHRMN